MAVQVRFSGIWRTLTGAQVFANGAWRSLVAIQAFVGGQWRIVGNFTVPPGDGGTFDLGTSASSVSGLGVVDSTTVTSGFVSAVPSGGLSPYSYSWAIVSSDGQTYVIHGPTSATVSVTGSGLPMDDVSTCTIRCTATDSLGSIAVSGDVAVSLTTHSTN
jgi:hypothetical protein